MKGVVVVPVDGVDGEREGTEVRLVAECFYEMLRKPKFFVSV